MFLDYFSFVTNLLISNAFEKSSRLTFEITRCFFNSRIPSLLQDWLQINLQPKSRNIKQREHERQHQLKYTSCFLKEIDIGNSGSEKNFWEEDLMRRNFSLVNLYWESFLGIGSTTEKPNYKNLEWWEDYKEPPHLK